MYILVLLLFVIFIWGIEPKKEINEKYLSPETSRAWKGFLAIIVIFHHLSQRMSGETLFNLFTYIGFFAVGIFFFFSGYGLQKKYMTDNRYSSGFLLNRIPKILFPYIIINIVYWCMYALIGKLYSFKDIVSMMIEGEPLALFSWYVVNILIFYFTFYILMTIAKKNYKFLIIGAVAAHILWVYGCTKLSFGEWWYCSSHLLVVGIIWATYEQRILNTIGKKFYPISITFTIVLLACVILKEFVVARSLIVFIKAIMALLFTVLVLLFSMKFQIGNPILDFLGKISFEVYLVHGLFIRGFRNDYVFVENKFLWAVLVLFSSIVFSIVFNKLCGLILARYYKRIASKSFT